MKIIILILKFVILLYSLKLSSSPLVETNWLSHNICNKKVKIIEVGNSYNSYLVEHINCSQYTNFYKDGWRKNFKKVNMVLPNPEKIIDILKRLGINNDDHIVLYTKKKEEYSVAETTAIYFSLKFIGHKKVSILNGGYPEFKKNHSLLTEEGKYPKVKASNYNYLLNNNILASTDDVIKNIEKNQLIVDARETDFYLGINKISNFSYFGTIKGAKNIPSRWFLKERGLKFNNIEKIKKIYKKKNIHNKENIIFFCNAGLESSLNWFVEHELMKNNTAKLYEGSIFKWISDNKVLFEFH